MSIVKGLLEAVVTIFFNIVFKVFGTPKIPDYIKKAIPKYHTGNFSELFQIIRIWDAPYELLDKYVPKAKTIIDLGCGDGLLANSLALRSKNSQVWGVDINNERVEEAKKGISNTHFIVGDITKKSIPEANVILLVHVLHHLPSKDAQVKLLDTCVKKLKKGGKLIVVEIQEKPLLKLILTWLVDAFVVPILFQKSLYDFKFWYRTRREWIRILKERNLKVKTITASANKPFSHVIFVATK